MDEPQIPWSRVANFFRQYTHDVRNGLHSLDLEATLLHDLVSDEAAVEGVERVHSHVRSMARHLRWISELIQDPQPTSAPVPAAALLSIWRENHSALPQAPAIQWTSTLGDEKVLADVAMMATVFRELLANASCFSKGAPLTIRAHTGSGLVILEMREPKSEPVDPSSWGQPFQSSQRGKYGLGLWTARRLVEACGARLDQRYHPGDRCLVTSISMAIL